MNVATLLILSQLTTGSASSPVALASDSTAPHSPAIPATAQYHPPVPKLVNAGDLKFLGLTVAGATLAVFNDQWLTNEAVKAEGNRTQRRLAQVFQPLGSSYVVTSAAVLYGASRLTGHPQVARRAGRLAISVSVATIVVNGIKEVAGRERPYESPTNSRLFKPFSGHSSFPSGHSATAFAAAVALDRETNGRWVPYLVYPAASLVAWSRVHDRAHWTSDVVAGAAIGGWVSWKTETMLARHSIFVPRTDGPPAPGHSWLLLPEPGGAQLVLVHAF
jgi:membrane-associated phospholipid phosphatase